MRDDPSIENFHQVDRFEDTGLYRAEWVDDIESMTDALLDFASVILSATGTRERWEIATRFEDAEQLSEFRSFCRDNDIDVSVQRLFELSQALTGRRYGLTEKQEEGLMAAWEAGNFESPRTATLTEVAGDLGITQQSLSNRLCRGHQALIANTPTIPGPNDE